MSLISKVSRKLEGEHNDSKDNNNADVNSERFLEGDFLKQIAVKNFQVRRKKYGFLARSQPLVKGFTFGSGRDVKGKNLFYSLLGIKITRNPRKYTRFHARARAI